jgi:hypothetical protein|tara:strand:- start:2943 stop:3350 length:408 start_codon:yes stop_codon:yes gene_type:complete
MAVEYANGSSLWASVSTPNKFGQYLIYLTTNEDEASRLESIGLSRVKDKSGVEKYEEPTFKFAKRVANRDGATNPAPKLIDTDGNTLDTLVGNGSDVTVKFKPYSNDFGTFAELVAVKVNNLVEYGEADPDNEEF